MTIEREKKSHSPPTGRRYGSVEEFFAGEGISQDVMSAISELEKHSRVVDSLIQARQETGLTQQQLADKVGKSQGAISKLESSNDDEITLKELDEYARATETTFCLMIGRKPNHIAMVKHHALSMRQHLVALAREAHRNKEAVQAIQGFFGEAFFNILTILDECADEMPKAKPARTESHIQLSKVGHIMYNRMSSGAHTNLA